MWHVLSSMAISKSLWKSYLGAFRDLFGCRSPFMQLSPSRTQDSWWKLTCSPSRPITLGMDGPQMSMSNTATYNEQHRGWIIENKSQEVMLIPDCWDGYWCLPEIWLLCLCIDWPVLPDSQNLKDPSIQILEKSCIFMYLISQYCYCCAHIFLLSISISKG